CGAACATRCSRNWKNKMCRKMCGICCSKCSCVPPGTGQDTRSLCPCYDAMRNPAGRPKLQGCVRGAVQQEPEEQDVQEDVWHLLLQVQLRAAGTGQDTRSRCRRYDAMRNPAGRP
ncbi:Gibberellin-regulated protein 9, partial [Ananas comosus]